MVANTAARPSNGQKVPRSGRRLVYLRRKTTQATLGDCHFASKDSEPAITSRERIDNSKDV